MAYLSYYKGSYGFISNRNRSVAEDMGSGIYTPILSNPVNLTGIPTATTAQWLRGGNVVTVSGMINGIAPTVVSTLSMLQMTLPVISNLTAIEDCIGNCACGAIASYVGSIIGNVANKKAQIRFMSLNLVSQNWTYHFTYQVK